MYRLLSAPKRRHSKRENSTFVGCGSVHEDAREFLVGLLILCFWNLLLQNYYYPQPYDLQIIVSVKAIGYVKTPLIHGPYSYNYP